MVNDLAILRMGASSPPAAVSHAARICIKGLFSFQLCQYCRVCWQEGGKFRSTMLQR